MNRHQNNHNLPPSSTAFWFGAGPPQQASQQPSGLPPPAAPLESQNSDLFLLGEGTRGALDAFNADNEGEEMMNPAQQLPPIARQRQRSVRLTSLRAPQEPMRRESTLRRGVLPPPDDDAQHGVEMFPPPRGGGGVIPPQFRQAPLAEGPNDDDNAFSPPSATRRENSDLDLLPNHQVPRQRSARLNSFTGPNRGVHRVDTIDLLLGLEPPTLDDDVEMQPRVDDDAFGTRQVSQVVDPFADSSSTGTSSSDVDSVVSPGATFRRNRLDSILDSAHPLGDGANDRRDAYRAPTLGTVDPSSSSTHAAPATTYTPHHDEKGKMYLHLALGGGVIFVLLLFISLFAVSFRAVELNHVGVWINELSGALRKTDGDVDVDSNGHHLVGFWFISATHRSTMRVVSFEKRYQALPAATKTSKSSKNNATSSEDDDGEKEALDPMNVTQAPISVFASSGQSLDIEVTLGFRVHKHEDVTKIMEHFGLQTDGGQAFTTAVASVAASSIRTTASQFSVELMATNRSLLQGELFKAVREKLKSDAFVSLEFLFVGRVFLPRQILTMKTKVFESIQNILTATYTRDATRVRLETKKETETLRNQAALIGVNATSFGQLLIDTAAARKRNRVSAVRGKALADMARALSNTSDPIASDAPLWQQFLLYMALMDSREEAANSIDGATKKRPTTLLSNVLSASLVTVRRRKP